jgi:hypothetical protein
LSLKEACEYIVSTKALQPRDGKTFCNMAARYVAQALGCNEFDDISLTAEDMGQIMLKNKSGRWSGVGGAKATAHALAGGLGFAFMSKAALESEHAHIAVVAPLPEDFSSSLCKTVPQLANVGRTNGYMKSSKAFPVSKGEADYYIWT